MSLAPQSKPAIQQGWIRAILLLVLYVGASVGIGYFLPSLETWIAASFVLALLLVYLFRVYVDKKSFVSIGLTGHDAVRNVAIGSCLAALLVSLATLVIFFLKGISWIDIMVSARSLFVSAVIMMMVAVSEEIVFRGYVLRNLLKSLNRWLALLSSALLFTVVHASNPSIPAVALVNTFFAGLLLGITFMHTRSLWLPISFHFIWNFLQGPVIGFPVSGIYFEHVLLLETKGSEIISGGEYGLEGSAVATVLLILTTTLWLVWEAKNPRPKEDYSLR